MTKQLISGLLLLSFSALAQSSFNFTINGNLRNVSDNSYAFIHHKWNGKDFTDSVKVKGENSLSLAKALKQTCFG